MPLGILIALVFGGIAGIAVLTHLFGMSKARLLRSNEDAAQAWLREFPDDRIVSTTLCQSGRAALVEAQSGLGLVWPMGADTTARPLANATVDGTKDGLTIRLSDFAAPKVTLSLTPDESLHWCKMIEAAHD